MLKVLCDGCLFGARHGTGRPRVLALHGWGRSHRDFDGVLDGLDALAVDLPGFGASPPPPAAWGSEEYAACVACVLDELESPAVVVGHSFGGGVSVHLAAASPGRVGALVLTGVPRLCAGDGRRPAPALAYRIGRALHRRRLLGDERMEALRRRYGSVDYATAIGVMRQVHVRAVNEDHEAVLGRLACPVELVWGEDDTAAPVGVARCAAKRIADARLTTLTGAGHMTPLTAAGDIRAAIERHL